LGRVARLGENKEGGNSSAERGLRATKKRKKVREVYSIRGTGGVEDA